MLNLAGFGSDEHQLFIQAGIEGLRDLLAIDLDDVPRPARARRDRSSTGAAADLMIETWWEQARTLEDGVAAGRAGRPRRRLPSRPWTRSAARSPPSSPASRRRSSSSRSRSCRS